ncbi:MAG: hypothetical protein QME96_11165 [Myxococcota bacterium]|nr:hypothetical protein [Myxococcota bacterium]
MSISTGGRIAALCMGACCLIAPSVSSAVRAELDSRTSAWLYPVVGRDGIAVADTFLLQSRLRLLLHDILPVDEGDADPTDDPDLAAATSLRWFYDFGVGGASDPDDPGFVPMLERTTLDVLFAYIEATNLIGGTLDARFGRLVHTGPLGWRSDDGLLLHAGRRRWAKLTLLGGVENLRGLWFSASPFSPDGIERWDVGGEAADRYYRRPGRETVRYRPVFQGSIASRVGPVGYDIGYRHAWKSLDGGTGESLFGAEVDVEVDSMSALAGVRVNAATAMLADVLAEASLGLAGGRHRVDVAYEFFTPTFDLDSIFWAFSADPFHEVTAKYRFPVLGPVSGQAWTSFRRVQEGGNSGDAEPVLGPFSDLGGGVGLSLRLARLVSSARWKVLRGTATSLSAFDLTTRVEAASRVAAWGVASIWQYEDRPRAGYHGVGGAGRLGARLRINPELAVDGELQVAHDPREGTTFAGFLWLDLGAVL